jgi:hypothetical protein
MNIFTLSNCKLDFSIATNIANLSLFMCRASEQASCLQGSGARGGKEHMPGALAASECLHLSTACLNADVCMTSERLAVQPPALAPPALNRKCTKQPTVGGLTQYAQGTSNHVRIS